MRTLERSMRNGLCQTAQRHLSVGVLVLLFSSYVLQGVAAAAVIAVNAGDDLQAALNSAAPGDTITLQAGATFAGDFVLPVKEGSTYITIRSSAPNGSLPVAGQR